jgi:hypothetical protein
MLGHVLRSFAVSIPVPLFTAVLVVILVAESARE